MEKINGISRIIMEYLESDKQLQFPQFLTMISLDNDEATELKIAKEFLFHSHSDLDKRLALEYFYINRCHPELIYFIEHNNHSSNELNREAAKLYQFMLDLRNGKPTHKIRVISKSISPNHPELKCLKYFLNMEIDVNVYHYDRIGYYINKVQNKLRQIDNPLYINFFKQRMQLIMFTYYWKRNELILARKHAYEALQMPHHVKQKAQLHLDLALSYIYEDFESSFYHIEEALYLAKCLQDHDTLDKISNYTYPFICANFGRIDGVTTNDPIEAAHLEIVKGNHQQAKEMLEKLSISTPFAQYYLGLATKNHHYFIHSYQQFMEIRNDHFFAKLPLRASEGLHI